MSEKNRESSFEYLKHHTISKISIIHSEIIDDIGINGAIEVAVAEIYDALKNKAELTIFDGTWDPIVEKGFMTMKDADQHIKQVSAASVIAKVTRDRMMKEFFSKKYPQYLFEKHKGYGTREHRDLIKQYGRCDLHRKSFRIKGYDDA